jgi:hypothetical protein
MDTATVVEGAHGSIGRSPLHRFAIRFSLVAMAVVAMWFAEDRRTAFARDLAADFHWNNGMWAAYGVALLLSGCAFGLAVWLPFSKVRYLPSRLVFAAIALIPFLKATLLLIEMQTGRGLSRWWTEPRWFDDTAIVAASTVLAGVAIASGFRARREA